MTLQGLLVVTLPPRGSARWLAANEPIDPRVRLAIAQWPDDAPRGAVSTFCAEQGISRKSFYELRKRAQVKGSAEVLAPQPRCHFLPLPLVSGGCSLALWRISSRMVSPVCLTISRPTRAAVPIAAGSDSESIHPKVSRFSSAPSNRIRSLLFVVGSVWVPPPPESCSATACEARRHLGRAPVRLVRQVPWTTEATESRIWQISGVSVVPDCSLIVSCGGRQRSARPAPVGRGDRGGRPAWRRVLARLARCAGR